MDEFDEIQKLFYSIALALSFFFVYIAMKKAPLPFVRGQSPPPRPPVVESVESSNVLKQLIDNGATFYGASWCGYTKKQLAELGITETESKGLDYVDCEQQEELCSSKNIDAFPTWQINGQMYPGYYPPAKLAELLSK